LIFGSIIKTFLNSSLITEKTSGFCSCLIHQAQLPNKLGNYIFKLCLAMAGGSVIASPSLPVIASRRRGNPGPPLLSLRAEGVAIPALLYCHCEPKAWQSRWDMGLLRHVVPRNDRRGCHCEPFFLLSLRAFFYLSLRAQRGNLGGAWDCFGTRVPRNDKGGCHCERSAAISQLLIQVSPFLVHTVN